MEKYAILDIGTNSIKFFIFSIENNDFEPILDTNNISRLGEGLLKTGIISPKAMARNIQVIKEYLEISKEHDVKEIIAVGTMCLRTAKNSDEFLKIVKDELGLKIQVISGKEEARLSYLAVLSTIGNASGEDITVFDTGGGSTEFIFGEGTHLKNRISLDVGAVQPTEQYLLSDPVTDDELNRMQNYLAQFLSNEIKHRSPDYLIGIGGTVTSMGAVKHKMVDYDRQVIQGSKLSLDDVKEQIDMFKNKTIEERKNIVGLQPKRADVMLAGASIVKAIMEHFNINKITISDSGLRHGILYDRLLKE
ncbi:MAG: Ppx/GppA family phosphatase [Candidatus Cloacimonetes bacterium]|nr:Ppx/GppA family phosphatase [Candidatus Cloacimonadota bacterium]